jgi:uncharacterized membrane protein YjgN (DUF898 family)
MDNYAALTAFQIVYYILFLYAVYRARRCQLSRTVWRSIRFAQIGDAKQYGLKFLGYWLLAGLTIGLTIPLATVRLQTYLVNNTFLGQENFSLHASAKDLFWK